MKGLFDKALNQTETQKVAKPGVDTVFALSALTDKGDQDAAAELFTLAAFATETLVKWCEAKPGMFTPIARDQISWPAMHSLNKGLVRKNDALLKALNLGGNTDINISEQGKGFSFDTPATRVAFDHYKLARILRRAPTDGWSADEPRQILFFLWSVLASIAQARRSVGEADKTNASNLFVLRFSTYLSYSFFWLIWTTALPPVSTLRLTAPLPGAGLSSPKVRRATVSIFSTYELRARISLSSSAVLVRLDQFPTSPQSMARLLHSPSSESD
jgi:hypothetical protein